MWHCALIKQPEQPSSRDGLIVGRRKGGVFAQCDEISFSMRAMPSEISSMDAAYEKRT